MHIFINTLLLYYNQQFNKINKNKKFKKSIKKLLNKCIRNILLYQKKIFKDKV